MEGRMIDVGTLLYWLVVVMGWAAGILFLVLLLLFVQDLLQKKHSVRRNFPLLGRLRYFLER
jgi:hypothetical protein